MGRFVHYRAHRELIRDALSSKERDIVETAAIILIAIQILVFISAYGWSFF
jgi:hypothetical protein